MIPIFLTFIIINTIVFFFSIDKSKKDQFYSDTHFLTPLGIYVWGDGLVLAPFWILSALAFSATYWWIGLTILQVFKFFILFHVVRSMYEVIYWLNHQAVGSEYNPPLFRKIKWLKAQDTSILYQLIHISIVVSGIAILNIIG